MFFFSLFLVRWLWLFFPAELNEIFIVVRETFAQSLIAFEIGYVGVGPFSMCILSK